MKKTTNVYYMMLGAFCEYLSVICFPMLAVYLFSRQLHLYAIITSIVAIAYLCYTVRASAMEFLDFYKMGKEETSISPEDKLLIKTLLNPTDSTLVIPVGKEARKSLLARLGIEE